MTSRTILGLVLIGLAGCEDQEPYEGSFDMPVAAAVLHPDTSPWFTEPVGFVANGHGGQIATLALKQGRHLTDDPTASFLRGSALPTGGDRLLSSIAVWAPPAGEVSLYAGDRAQQTLLYVPWIVGREADGSPLEGWRCESDCPEGVNRRPVFTPPELCTVDGECTEQAGLLSDLELKLGYTTTETWTLRWVEVDSGWSVEGSRSGRQPRLASRGEPFFAEKRRVAFTVTRGGADGEVIRFTTDNGVREIDVGGVPQHLAMAADQSKLAVVVHDGALDRPVLRWLDPYSRTLAGEVALPDDARPGRLAWSEDGSQLFVSDTQRHAVWALAPGSVSATEYPLPWPTADIAPLFSEAHGQLLYVAPVEVNEVWILDLDTGELRDINPGAPGVQGMTFESPVTGIEAMPLDHLWRGVNDYGVRESGRSVAVSTHEGRVVFMEEGSGCLVQDELGPRTEISSSFGSSTDIDNNYDGTTSTGAVMQSNAQDTGRHVIVSSCAGTARAERWTLTFDRNRSGWEVEGTVSGVQPELAYEDERYVSARGEVSFVLLAGATPSRDGWQITFRTLEGALVANGDIDRDGVREVNMDVPGDPVFFHYTVGPDWFGDPYPPAEPAWKRVDDRAFVLVPSMASNLVGRVNPQEASIELSWN